jgi:hypothetical protein
VVIINPVFFFLPFDGRGVFYSKWLLIDLATCSVMPGSSIKASSEASLILSIEPKCLSRAVRHGAAERRGFRRRSCPAASARGRGKQGYSNPRLVDSYLNTFF